MIDRRVDEFEINKKELMREVESRGWGRHNER
jgi:hypothetical protein